MRSSTSMGSHKSILHSEPPALALPPLILGGAGFSYQLTPDPKALPVLEIVKKAFELGIRAIDTSPYYEPSEGLLGAALSHPDISSKYQRSDFILMTKCGRIAEKHFDYSPVWIRKSVSRSLSRFKTPYLDVVFCHDVEFVHLEEAVAAVGVLFDLSENGIVKNVGISGYDIGVLLSVATHVRSRYGRSVDVVQNWAQLTLQNTRLEHQGLAAFRSLGVKAVCNASPLASGLLRDGGVPIGSLGDWHPAPGGLRAAAHEAATWVHEQGDSLASLALRFAMAKAMEHSQSGLSVTTITGVSSITELNDNVQTARRMLPPLAESASQSVLKWEGTSGFLGSLDQESFASDLPLYQGVRKILGHWVDYDFSGRPSGRDKASIEQVEGLQVAKSEETTVSRL